jgi:hypothetical protein
MTGLTNRAAIYTPLFQRRGEFGDSGRVLWPELPINAGNSD